MTQHHGPAGPTHFVTPRAEQHKAAPVPVQSATELAQQEVTDTVNAEPRPVPTIGFPALWFSVKKTLNKNAVPPHLSKKEIAHRAAQAEIEEQNRRAQEEIEERLRLAKRAYDAERELSDKCPHLVIVYIGVKGSAATTTTMVYTASIFADDTRTLVYGADFNPASGTAGARLGKEFGDTISIQQFAEIVEEVKGDRKSVNARLRPTRYGVRVLSADDYTKIPGEQYGTTTQKMLNVLDENCDYLLLDTPNDITTPAARAIIAKADVIVFTANVGERDSLRLLRVSMDTVRELGYTYKVADSVVVVSNVPSGTPRDEYVKYLGKVNLNHEITGELSHGEFKGQLLTVPHDPQIALNGEVVIEALDSATVQAYRDINIAVLEQGFETKNRTNITALERSIS